MPSSQMVDNLNALALRKQSRTIDVLEQTGKSFDVVRDRGRLAKLPGKRISKTGKVYWETRVNRSDALNKKV